MVTKASGLDKLGESFVEEAAPKKRRGKKLHDEAVENAGAIVDAATPKQRAKLAKVGMNALVDEATGFQKVRPKNALRKMLDERDPAVVAAQTCSSCGEEGHEFNDCPNVESLAEQPADKEVAVYERPTNGALAAEVFFSKDGWLKLPKDTPFEIYTSLVARFGVFHKNMLWMAGDLQAQGEALYGQEYSQVVELLAGHGYTESTLSIAKKMSETFPPAERHQDLSWNHHLIVMGWHPGGKESFSVGTLSKKERKHWLDRASAENLSTRQLKELIAAAHGKPAKAPAKAAPEREPDEPDEDAFDDVETVVRTSKQPVTVAPGGVSAELLSRVDNADHDFYEVLEPAIIDMKAEGTFDYDALRPVARALAASLLELIEALGQ